MNAAERQVRAFFLGGPLHGECRWAPDAQQVLTVHVPYEIRLDQGESPGDTTHLKAIIYERQTLCIPARTKLIVFVCNEKPHKTTTELETALWLHLRPEFFKAAWTAPVAANAAPADFER